MSRATAALWSIAIIAAGSALAVPVRAAAADEIVVSGAGDGARLGLSTRTSVSSLGRPKTTRCPVTTSSHATGRYGSRRLWVTLPNRGVLRVSRNRPDDGLFGTKLAWIPDRDRDLALSVRGHRLDAPGTMRVRGVYWGYSSSGKGSWASAVAFPHGGCWRITGRAGPTVVSYVVRVVTSR